MIDVAAGLLNVAKSVFELVSGSKAMQQADRDRAGDYFAVVGATLAEIAAEIGAGRTPHGKCGELMTHAAHFVGCTEQVIGKAEAERLAAILYASHDVEGMAMQLAAPAERGAQIAALAEAAGRFSAMAHIVRAGH
jgi:hypothetical protein